LVLVAHDDESCEVSLVQFCCRFIPFTASVEDAIRTLNESGVSVLPIAHQAGVDTSSVSFSGLVELLVKVNFEKEVFLRSNICEARTYGKMLNMRPYATIEECVTLMDNNHLYEVGLLEPDGSKVEHFVSQSDVVRFIYFNREQLLWDRKVKLHHIPSLGSSNVGTVCEATTVASCCKMLIEMHVNAVAVVDNDNAMQGCLTPSSFQELSSQHWINFHDAVGKFKIEGRDQGWVYAEETLEHMLEHLVLHNLHRIWVISDSGQPTRIITLSDIIGHFVDLHKSESNNKLKK
jgi:CBS-domain-containing membrane protein